MTHPNAVTTNYIWQRFCESYMAEGTLQTMKTVEDVVKAATHRPIHHGSECRNFAASYLEKITKLKQHCAHLDFTEETERFEKMG